MICSGLMGLAGGAVGAVFYHMVSWANRVRAVHPELLWLLPVGGLAIVAGGMGRTRARPPSGAGIGAAQGRITGWMDHRSAGQP